MSERYSETDRNFRIGGNPILPPVAAPPPPPAPVIGWLSPITSTSGTAAHANSGTGGGAPGPPLFISTFPSPGYAGVVGYTTGAVVWSSTWSSLFGDTAPTLSTPNVYDPDLDDFVPAPWLVSVSWPPLAVQGRSRGLLILSATVNGVPVGAGQTIEAATAENNYSTIAWGPTP